MSPRERVVTAMRRETPDRVPKSAGFTPAVQEKFELATGQTNAAEYFGYETRGLGFRGSEYGDRLAFWGCIGTQTTMPFGSADEVRANVKWTIENVGQGGGLFIAPTHVLEPEVPWENVEALFEAVAEYGAY